MARFRKPDHSFFLLVLGVLFLLVIGLSAPIKKTTSGATWSILRHGDVPDAPKRPFVSSKDIFENMDATWPDADAIRAASIDRFLSATMDLHPNLANDLFANEQHAFSLRTWIPTTNPLPILMLESDASVFQLRYQRSEVTEVNIRSVLREVFGTGCLTTPDHGFVLDVGANEGFYGLLATAYGCRAISMEPQPTCVAWLSWAVAMNRFVHPLKVIQKVAHESSDQTFEVPSIGCSGMAQYHGSAPNQTATVRVGSVAVDALVAHNGGRALLLHMDVEGAEVIVLRSAAASIANRTLDNIVFEMNVGRWAGFGVSTEQGMDELQKLIRAGYVCRDMRRSGLASPVHSIAPFARFHDLDVRSETDVWCTLDANYTKVSVPNTQKGPNDQTGPGRIPANPGKLSDLVG
jgi:FkbM family methyltransferase